MKKILLLLVFTFVLIGCAKENTKVNELYKDLDAKETYEKAIEYFNENITYFKSHQIGQHNGGSSKAEIEFFNQKNKYSRIHSYYTYKKDDLVSSILSITKDGKVCETSVGNEVDSEKSHIFSAATESDNDYSKAMEKLIQHPFFTSVLTGKGVKLFDISKKEDNNELIIEKKHSVTSTQSESTTGEEKTYTGYYIMKTTIQSDGLICKESLTSYKDKTFSEIQSTLEAVYRDYNKRESFDYNEETKKLKKLEGKDIKELEDKINF